MPSTHSSSEASKAEAAQKREERKKKIAILVKDIQTDLEKDVDCNDTLFRDKTNECRQLLEIPSGKHIKDYDSVDLKKEITKLISEWGKIDYSAKRREEYSPCELVENAAGGLALKGILPLGDICIKKTVLAAPSNVKLKGSSLPQIDKEVNLSSKEQSDYFSSDIRKVGFSAATNIKINRPFFGFEGGFAMKRENDNERQKERHSQICFNSQVRCHFVPMCSCELSPYSLTLSQEALSRLTEVDIKIRLGEDQKDISKLCHDFMNSYGSHVYTGPLHFGGIYNISATYSSENKANSDTIQAMTREALSTHASAAFSGFGYSASGSISGDSREYERNSSFSNDKSEKANISFHSAKIGGSVEEGGLPIWKMGLINDNTTWTIIDREIDKKENFVGIWELIKNHRDDFDHHEELKSNLKTTWEEICAEATNMELDIGEGEIPFSHFLEKGFRAGCSLTVAGTVPANARRFQIDLLNKETIANGNIFMHVNPRFNEKQLVLNNTKEGRWHHEERSGLASLSRGNRFKITLQSTDTDVKVIIDGKLHYSFQHRSSPSQVTRIRIEGDVYLSKLTYNCGTICAEATSMELDIGENEIPFSHFLEKGFRAGCSLTVAGTVPANARRFQIDLLTSVIANANILIHVNPRFNEKIMVLNSFERGSWQSEERSGLASLSRGRRFQITLECTHTDVKVVIDGKLHYSLQHRISPSDVTHMRIDGDVSLSKFTYNYGTIDFNDE